MDPDENALPSSSRPIAIAGATSRELAGTWSFARVAAEAATDPAAARATIQQQDWRNATVPGTVASALIAAGEWDWDAPPGIDADDWWYRCEFAADEGKTGRRQFLRFDGLATIAEVWLNDQLVLASHSMWVSRNADVTGLLTKDNTLMIRFASLQKALEAKRPRPRWRTRVVEQQQLRWWRTSWLGRMPGWSPAAPAIGPWRGIRLETRDAILEDNFSLVPVVKGTTGVLVVVAQLFTDGGRAEVKRAVITCGEHETVLRAKRVEEHTVLSGEVEIPNVERWWPHTHGTPKLYDVTLTVETTDETTTTSLGRVGFRDVVVDRGADEKGFALRINDIACFARGSCWSPIDVASLGGTPDVYREALEQVRDAGFNMLRISGTMAYESDVFHDLCDELGIMVWQDFMFANMDYPHDDPAFVERVRAEVMQVAGRLKHRPSLVVLCGGSEVFQQASMLGLASDSWTGSIFTDLIPTMCATSAPFTAYVANSPMGGPLPFAANEGISHYYGVGAYLRPLEDARRADVRFITECLGFANVPDPRTIKLIGTPTDMGPHHLRWKLRVPRDRGAEWDFDDVRDHYFRLLFGADPAQVRYTNVDRYLAMSRVVTGEVMARTMAEWRRGGSACAGALVWMHRDLWPSAGWGIVDSTGLAKAAYWYLARACSPLALLITDEGVNGLALHAMNDRPTPIDAELAVQLWSGKNVVAEGAQPMTLQPRSSSTLSADEILGRFTDVSYAYRFGPQGHDFVVATLRDRASGSVLSESFHFPGELRTLPADPRMTAEAVPDADENWVLIIRCDSAAIAVAVDIEGFTPSDSYFHMTPGSTKRITLHSKATTGMPTGTLFALNADQPARVIVRSGNDAKRPTIAP